MLDQFSNKTTLKLNNYKTEKHYVGIQLALNNYNTDCGDPNVSTSDRKWVTAILLNDNDLNHSSNRYRV
jgi:hypothetical protein